jgi:predicted acetyltransferase
MRKHKNFQQPKRFGSVISFVVDGKCEYWYLQKWKECENLNVNLNPKLPKTKDLLRQFELVVELSEESEKVFWVVDFDTILAETRKAIKGRKTALQEFQELYNECAKNEKIVVIVNNPCLEYWYLLHFKATSKFYNAYEPHLKRDLLKVLSDYEKTEKYYKNQRLNIYERLKPNLQIAISHSEKLGEFDFGKIQTEGIAEMYKIFNELKNIEK